MKNRIVKNNLIISTLGCTLAVLCCIIVFMKYMQETMYAQVESQTKLLMHILETTPEDNFEILYTVEGMTAGRVTYIYHNGLVTYDSDYKVEDMESHADREEVILALENEIATTQRISSTTGRMTYYCAAKVGDGSVVRVALTTTEFLIGILLSTSPLVLICIVIIAIICFALSGKTTRKIVENIERYDVEKGAGDIYEELFPFINKIKRQNDIISRQVQSITEEKLKLQNIFQNVKEGIIVCDSRYNIIQSNPEAIELFELEENENNFCTSVKIPELHQAVEKAVNGETVQCVFEKGEKWYQAIASSNIYVGDHGAILIIIDITDQIENEKNRRRFTDNVTHELKTPLTSILGYSQLISNGIAKEDDIVDFVKIIEQNAVFLLEMIDDVIRISNLETGDGFFKTELQLDEIIRYTMRHQYPVAESKNVILNCELEPVTITADESRMYQMTNNLMSNAIKYNKPGGTVNITLTADNNWATLVVEDNGIGISSENIDKIFERFYVVDKSRNKNISSSGLGLAIVKHVVKAHNGNISVKSSRNKGSQFTVQLPVK